MPVPAPRCLLALENTLMLQYNAGNSATCLDTNAAGKNGIHSIPWVTSKINSGGWGRKIKTDYWERKALECGWRELGRQELEYLNTGGRENREESNGSEFGSRHAQRKCQMMWSFNRKQLALNNFVLFGHWSCQAKKFNLLRTATFPKWCLLALYSPRGMQWVEPYLLLLSWPY